MLILSYAFAQTSQTQSQATPNPLVSFMPVILIFFIFYFLLIRPQKKRQTEHERMVSQLKKNDEVITSGGIHGVVVGIKDTTVMLRIDEGVKIEVQKSAIAHFKKK